MMSRPTCRLREALLAGLALFGLLLLAQSAWSQPASRGGDSRGSAPLKIGFLNTRTGPLAGLGEFYNLGLTVAMEEVNYEAAGRKLVVVSEDDSGTADTGLTKARKLVESDHVDILIAGLNSAVALAIRDYVVSKGIPWVIFQASVANLTEEKGAPNIFRTSFTDPQIQAPMGRYVYEKLGHKRLILLGLDYVAGHTNVAGFEKGFTEAGGQVVQKIFIALGSPDHAPFISRIDTRNADGLHVVIWGADAIRFFRQAHEYRLRDRIKMTAYGSGVDDGVALPAFKDDEVLGLVNNESYAAAYDSPVNRKFVEAFVAKSGGRMPSLHGALGYEAARAVIEALKARQGNVENIPAFLAALRSVRYDSPRGPFRFDACQNAVINVYVRKVEKVAGRVQNSVVDVLRGVTAPGCTK